MLGVEKTFKRYLFHNLLVRGGKSFADIFISIYLWRLGQNFLIVLAYFLITRLVMLFSFSFIGGPLTKKISPLYSLKIGILFTILFYSSFLFLGKNSLQFFWALAIIHGIKTGIFILGDHTLKHDLSSSDGRQRNFSILSIMTMAVKFLAPLIAGFIIASSVLEASKAYTPIFCIALSLFALAFINSFFFKDYKNSGERYNLLEKSALLIKNRNFRILSSSSFFTGFTYGLIPIVIPMLIYLLSLTEKTVGAFESLKVLITIIILFIVGKYVSSKKYKFYLVTLGALAFFIHLLPAVYPALWTIFLYGFLISLVYAPAEVLWDTIYYNLIKQMCKTKKCMDDTKIEYLVIQEVLGHLGTIIGILILFCIYLFSNNLILALQIMVGVLGISMFLWFYQASRIEIKPTQIELDKEIKIINK